MAESEKDLKTLLMRMHRRVEKAVIRQLVNILRKIMASGPITSWQIEGEKSETVNIFIFLNSKSLWTMTKVVKLKDTCSLEESHDKPRQHIKSETSLCQQRSLESELNNIQLLVIKGPFQINWKSNTSIKYKFYHSYLTLFFPVSLCIINFPQ